MQNRRGIFAAIGAMPPDDGTGACFVLDTPASRYPLSHEGEVIGVQARELGAL